MRRYGIFILGFWLVGMNVGLAQNVSASLSAGIFFPQQDVFRDIYGSGIPAALDIWTKISDEIGLSAGVTYCGVSGQALSLEGGGETYPLRLRLISVPVSIYYEWRKHRLAIRLGGGIGFSFYKETWEAVELMTSGNHLSPQFFVSVAHRLRPHLSVFGSVRYQSIPTGLSSPYFENVNLGGVFLLAGIMLGVF